MGAIRRSRALFEEPPHADAETFEDAGKDQFVFESQRPRRVGWAEDMGGLWLGIKDNDR